MRVIVKKKVNCKKNKTAVYMTFVDKVLKFQAEKFKLICSKSVVES